MRIFYFTKDRLYLFLAITLTVAFLVGSILYLRDTRNYVEEVSETPLLITYDPFREVLIEGDSAYVYDVKNRRSIHSLNPTATLPLASITKIMTAFVALENIPSTETITIMPQDLGTEGGSGLIPYEAWRVGDLIDFTLIVSSNDGAEALRRVGNQYTLERNGQTFIETMNSRAKEIGMEDSVFYNPTGLDQDLSRAGSYSNARDVSTMFNFLLSNYPFLIEESAHAEETFTSISGISHVARNTNRLTETIPDLIASKTGFTDLAGGNLAVVVEPESGRPIIIVVLASSLEGRFSDVNSLYHRTKLYLSAEKKVEDFLEEIEELREELL